MDSIPTWGTNQLNVAAELIWESKLTSSFNDEAGERTGRLSRAPPIQLTPNIMSKTNHQRGDKSQKHQKHPKKRHTKNQLIGDDNPLTGSVHAADYPDDGFTSRIRQRENDATRKMAQQYYDDLSC